VGNLNYRTTKEALVAFLSPAGEVVDAFLPTDRETGRPRGFGFITFASEDQARACIEQFNGADFEGRQLNINAADDRRRGPGGPGGAPRGGPGGPGRGGPPRRGRPSPIAEFKRGGPSDRPPPRRSAPPPSPEELAAPSYDPDDRKFNDGGADEEEPSWKKKKKKRKGSRRGLRAKKRSL
tara:strand:- start:3092 stop:3631 length:540 start_codon:yes stop_codon:yes gene_type:complete